MVRLADAQCSCNGISPRQACALPAAIEDHLNLSPRLGDEEAAPSASAMPPAHFAVRDECLNHGGEREAEENWPLALARIPLKPSITIVAPHGSEAILYPRHQCGRNFHLNGLAKRSRRCCGSNAAT
jgi:hypothetical protein